MDMGNRLNSANSSEQQVLVAVEGSFTQRQVHRIRDNELCQCHDVRNHL